MIRKMDGAALEPLYAKKVECLHCKNQFTTKKVRTRFVKPRVIENDFGPLFQQGDPNNPLFYYIVVCPVCGFSFSNDFSGRISQKARDEIQLQITAKMDKSTDFCQKRTFEQAVRSYKLAIYSGQLVRERHIVFGNLCLRLAWLYRGIANEKEENRFLQLAADEYEQSYIHTDFNVETTPEISILYLIGELNRRLGQYAEAVKYFTSVTEHPDRSRYMKYTNLARLQWKIAVDQYRESKEKEHGNEKNEC